MLDCDRKKYTKILEYSIFIYFNLIIWTYHISKLLDLTDLYL